MKLSNAQKQFLAVADDQWRRISQLGREATAQSLAKLGYVEISGNNARLTESGQQRKNGLGY